MSAPLQSHRSWRPRCEGCGVFVPATGHHPSDYRWCKTCADALPLDAWEQSAMIDRLEAERLGWPMWPLSDVFAA